MKFNFWQMLGVLLLIAGTGLFIYREMHKPAATPNPAPATQPAI
jgi:hypothetical protein